MDLDLQSVLSEFMELGFELDLVELSQKRMSYTPDQVLILSLERLLQAKKLEVTKQRHNLQSFGDAIKLFIKEHKLFENKKIKKSKILQTQVAKLQMLLVEAHLKIKQLEDQVVAKNTKIGTLKSEVMNTKSYSRRSSDQVQETMDDDEDYETFDWASEQMPGSSAFHSACSGNYSSSRETAEKSTCTDEPFATMSEVPSQRDITAIPISEESDAREEIYTISSNQSDSGRICNIFPDLVQAESQAADENDFEVHMLAILGSNAVRGGSPRTSINSRSSVCPHCQAKLASNSVLHKHLFVMHSEQRGVHICEPCRSGYPTKTELMRHKRRAHKTVVPSLPCRHCGNFFSSYAGRLGHEMMHSGTNGQFERAQCIKCEKSFETIKSLERHEKKAHSKN